MDDLRPHLQALEQSVAAGAVADPRPALAYLAGHAVTLDEGELHGARRRALLLQAAGGDPLRALELDGRAVTALAEELGSPGARRRLHEGLAAIRPSAEGLPHCTLALVELVSDEELAWRAFAAALLADELSG